MQTQVIAMPISRSSRADAAPTSLPTLPDVFADLAPFAPVWALDTETKRNMQRHAASMDEIKAFGDAILPRVDDIVAYLNGFALDALPPDGAVLMQMLLSLAEIAPALEFYGQQAVIDGYDPRRFVASETFVMRPPL